jgi:glycosyltransferase involved in cell wall biosynthesis
MIVSLTQRDALDWKTINPHVEVIPNVVHLNNSGKYNDRSFKTAIFVGRYSYQKDLQSLLRVWEIVSQRHSDWQLHIYGGYGIEKDQVLSEIKKMDASILVHESTSDIMERYKESSILLLTSRYEPFGLVLPEAMSCGLPVVAFDCPYGPADIIADGVDGFLIKNRDIDEFANKVCQLIESEELRRQMGNNGIISSQRYRADAVMPQWIRLFDELTSGQ